MSVEEELSVPPPSLIDLINDPLLTSSEPLLVFDRANAVWQLGFKHSHRMMMNGQLTKMSMRVDVAVPKLVELLSGSTDATDGNSPEALARIRGHLEARVQEIIAEMQAVASDASAPKADRLKRIEPLYREGAGYAVLSGELRRSTTPRRNSREPRRALTRQDGVDQPRIVDPGQREFPLPLIVAPRPVAESWHVGGDAAAGRHRASVAD